MSMENLYNWFISRPEIFLTNSDTVGYLVICLVGMVWIHEGVHYKVAEGYGLKPRFGVDWRGWYVETEIKASPKQERDIVWESVLLGSLPVWLCFFLTGFWAFGLLVTYLLGISSDIVLLWRLRKNGC